MFNIKEKKLVKAIESKDFSNIHKLLNTKINLSYLSPKDNSSFLILFIKKFSSFDEMLPIMSKLLDSHVNINHTDIYGQSALQYALYKPLNANTKKIVHWLYEHDATFTTKNASLLFQLIESHEDTFFYLLDHYPELNINQKNKISEQSEIGSPLNLGQTYLLESLYQEKYEFAQKLLNQGANPLISNKDGETALDVASQYNEAITVNIIQNYYNQIKDVFDINKIDKEFIDAKNLWHSLKEKDYLEIKVLPIVKKVKNKI